MAGTSDYLHGRIQSQTGDVVRIAVVYADGRELSAVIQGQVELPPKARCAFKFDDGVIELLVRVVDVRQQGTETGAALSIISAYSQRDREHVELFLASRCGITQFSVDAFEENEKGCYCMLDPKRLARRRKKRTATDEQKQSQSQSNTKRTPKKKVVPVLGDVERRWQTRVRHIISGAVESGDKSIDAIIFEVSERGLRISVPAEELPHLDLNGAIKLYLAFPSGRLTIRSRCLCKVAWWLPPEPGEDEATLGLEIVEVIDGVHGQQWARFIDAMHESGMVVQIGEHGSPRD